MHCKEDVVRCMSAAVDPACCEFQFSTAKRHGVKDADPLDTPELEKNAVKSSRRSSLDRGFCASKLAAKCGQVLSEGKIAAKCFPPGFSVEPRYHKSCARLLVESMAHVQVNGKGAFIPIVMRIEQDGGLRLFDGFEDDITLADAAAAGADLDLGLSLATAAHMTLGEAMTDTADKCDRDHSFELKLSSKAQEISSSRWTGTRYVISVSAAQLVDDWRHTLLVHGSPAMIIERSLMLCERLASFHASTAAEWEFKKTNIPLQLENAETVVERAVELITDYGITDTKDSKEFCDLAKRNFEALQSTEDVGRTVTSTLKYITRSLDGTKRQTSLVCARQGWAPVQFNSSTCAYFPHTWCEKDRCDERRKLMTQLQTSKSVRGYYSGIEGRMAESRTSVRSLYSNHNPTAACQSDADASTILSEARIQRDGKGGFATVWLKLSASCDARNFLWVFADASHEETLACMWLPGATISTDAEQGLKARLERARSKEQQEQLDFKLVLRQGSSIGWDTLSYCIAFDSEQVTNTWSSLIRDRVALSGILPPSVSLAQFGLARIAAW